MKTILALDSWRDCNYADNHATRNKNTGKCRITLGCLEQNTFRWFRLRNSQDCEVWGSANKTIGIITKLFRVFGQNLVILTWMDDELLCGQTSSSDLGKFDLEVKIELEVQSRFPKKQKGP